MWVLFANQHGGRWMAGSITKSSPSKSFGDPVPGWGGILSRLAAIPLPLRVLSLLGLGLSAGLLFPRTSIVKAIYLSGTYFPRCIVTLAALLIFHLITAAMAKLVLHHKDRAGALFFRIVTIYVLMGIVSL